MQDPVFEVVDGQYNFVDTGGIYSQQMARRDPDQVPATNGLDTRVWGVKNAAFAAQQLTISFELKSNQDILTIKEIPTKKEAKVGLYMPIDLESNTYIE